MDSTRFDVVVIGAGAAGLATSIFAARRSPDVTVVALDGAKRLGAKILVSGGGRCNVTNAAVTPSDYFGGSRNTIRRVLSRLRVAETIAFFRELGVSLHEEEHGKLFPDSNRASTVLDALLGECRRRGVELRTDHRVRRIERRGDGFLIETARGVLGARRVVLATGGLSLPKTGSDGGGYDLARSLGHSIVTPTPALVPLVLEGDFHASLAGVSHEAEWILRIEGGKMVRMRGAMLWTHFGASGPVVMDLSRHWHRARLEQRTMRVAVNFLPGHAFESAERAWMSHASRRPKAHVRTLAAEWLPARVADALLSVACVAPAIPLAHVSREDRRRLLRALLEFEVAVRDSRGFGYAEVTAGGVPLDEIDSASMQSRICPGLHLVGEILDVDGRIGGFNFQWSWSSARVAADGL